MIGSFIGVLFDGIAYGSLLFLISIGLSVTLGLMRFANLAHGVFAMVGGYVAALGTTNLGLPFLLTLPLAFALCAALGAVLERLLYRHLYGSAPLDQVLFTVGLIFVAIALATWQWGPLQQAIQIPAWLKGEWTVLGVGFGVYRVFMIAVVVGIMALLGAVLTRTRFGAQVRAAVDNRAAATGLGINVGRVFTLTFALGSGLAGLGGALGVEILGLDPNYPLKFLVFFLLVVVVGGAGSFRGPLVAALILGVFDIAGKYYVPEAGVYIQYVLMIVLLVAFPAGLAGRR